MSIHENWYAVSDMLATDLIKTLYEDAGRETDPERAAQLRRDADTLKDVWQRTPYASAPTRDQMTAALGNASLNIADTLSELAREMRSVKTNVSEMHLDVQSSNTLVSTFLETVPPQINSALGEVKTELISLNHGFSALGERVDNLALVQADHTKHLHKHDAQIATLTKRVDEHDEKFDLVAALYAETGATQSTIETLKRLRTKRER